MSAKLVSSDPSRVVVRIAEDTRENRAEARKVAMRAAGTVTIGALQSVTPRKGTSVELTWTPNLNRVSPPVREVAVPAAPKAPKVDPRDAKIAELERMLAELRGEAPKAPKAAPEFLRKDDAGITCKTCRDFGVVRKAGEHAGQAYKTAKGAEAATANGNSVPCTGAAHKVRKGRKSA